MAESVRPDWRSPALEITLGVSSYLLGEEVRHDGGHQRDGFVADTLARYVRWVSVCPEMEIGLGTPQETLRLVGDPAAPRMVAPKSGADHTGTMRAFATRRVRELAAVAIATLSSASRPPGRSLTPREPPAKLGPLVPRRTPARLPQSGGRAQ